MATPAAVIFDNDGLLLDTESVWSRGEEELFRRRGLEFTLEHKRELVGTSAQAAGATLARQLGEPGTDAELIAELDGLVLDELERGVEPLAGAVELVAELQGRGVPPAWSRTRRCGFITRALELGGLDGFACGRERPRRAGPEAGPRRLPGGLRAARRSPRRPTSSRFEDSPTGVAAARAAGLTVLGVPSLDGDRARRGARGVRIARRARGAGAARDSEGRSVRVVGGVRRRPRFLGERGQLEHARARPPRAPRSPPRPSGRRARPAGGR